MVFPTVKEWFCSLYNERASAHQASAHQSSITFFWYTLYRVSQKKPDSFHIQISRITAVIWQKLPKYLISKKYQISELSIN